ncbi:MAG: lipopolysaccharide biosynthesis protein, partial [Promethearchaeota archaeon]
MNQLEQQQQGTQRMKKFGTHVSASLAVAIVLKIINLILVKILTVFIAKEEYAIYSLILSLVALLSTFSTTAFSESLARFLPRHRVAGRKEDAARLFLTVILASLIVLTFILLGLVFTGLLGLEDVIDDEILWAVVIIGLLALIYNIKEIILVSSNSEQNSREVVTYNLAYTLSASFLASIFAITIGSYEALLVGLIIGYGLPVLVTLGSKVKRYGSVAPNLEELRNVTKYGSPFVLMNTIPYLVNFMSVYAIGVYIGLSFMASFSIALSVTSLFAFAVSPPMVAYRAYVVATYESGDLEEGNLITSRIIELYCMLAVFFLWGIGIFTPIIIPIISTVNYLDAAVLVPYTLFSAFLISSTYFWRLRVDLSERTYLTGIASFLSLVPYVIVLVVLLPTIGIIGAGVAMCIQALTAMVMIIYLGNREYRISLDRGFFLRWLGSVLILVFSYMITNQKIG